MHEGYKTANLSSKQTEKVKQLESELECTLIAYERMEEHNTETAPPLNPF